MTTLTKAKIDSVQSIFYHGINLEVLGNFPKRRDGISCKAAEPFVQWYFETTRDYPRFLMAPSQHVLKAAIEARRIFTDIEKAASEAGNAYEVGEARRAIEAIGEILDIITPG